MTKLPDSKEWAFKVNRAGDDIDDIKYILRDYGEQILEAAMNLVDNAEYYDDEIPSNLRIRIWNRLETLKAEIKKS